MRYLLLINLHEREGKLISMVSRYSRTDCCFLFNVDVDISHKEFPVESFLPFHGRFITNNVRLSEKKLESFVFNESFNYTCCNFY